LLIALNEEDRAGLVNALKVSFFFTIWFAYDYLEIGLFIFVTFRDCFLFLTSFEKLIWFLWLREFDFGFEDCLCILIWLFESLWLFLIWFTCLLQNKLQNLAGQHSDVLENLTPPVRKRVEFLREIQVSKFSAFRWSWILYWFWISWLFRSNEFLVEQIYLIPFVF
jgi:hypothetical protein